MTVHQEGWVVSTESSFSLQQVRVMVRIPKHYQQEPLLSDLITRHGLQVNIYAAQLSGSGPEDGWFDLGLSGHPFQINSALSYLDDQNVEVWDRSHQGEDY